MRGLTKQHLVKNDSHRPNVAFRRVSIAIKYLGTHVHRTTNQRLMDLIKLGTLLIKLGKTKISKFISFIFDKNVGRFEVSMNHGVFVEVFITINYLSHDDNGFVLREFFPFIENVLEWTSVAEFLEQVNVIRGLFDIKELYNVLVLYRLHNFDFVFQGFVELLRVFFDVAGRNCFNCYELAGAYISAFEDFTIRTASNFVVNVNNKRLNEFVIRSAQLSSFLLYFLHFCFVHLKFFSNYWNFNVKFQSIYFNFIRKTTHII